MNRTGIFAGISLITMSVLMLELGLTRIFSATMYYHFAFMAISLALFGSGASGVFVYIVRPRLTDASTTRWLGIASQLFAATTVTALLVVLNNELGLAADAENYYTLLKIYAATTLPFFFAGCAITLAITRFAEDISRLYVWDLAGAAVGCLLLIPVLNAIGGINLVLLVALFGALASVIFSAAGRNRTLLYTTAALTAGYLGALVYNVATRDLDVRRAKGTEQSSILFSKWNSFSRITVHGSLDSPNVEILIDADAATSMSRNAGHARERRETFDYIPSIAYRLRNDGSALIIGPGGGGDVMTALSVGMKSITAVEINPIIGRDVMSSEPFKSYTAGLYEQPGVRLVIDEGRSFIRSSSERYDVIQATMVDTWAATGAGAFALTENNLYTVEAFKDYVAHLTDDGILTMTRWYFEPPDQTLRLLSIARAMMQEMAGELRIVDPARHVMLVVAEVKDSVAPATLMIKRSPFTDEEVQTIESLAAEHNYTLLYTPLTRPPNVFTRMMETPNPGEQWSSFETNVAPTYDNNPFFFNTVRLSNLGTAASGAWEWRKNNLGTFVLFSLFTITLVLVVLFILGPLLLVRRKDLAGGSNKIPYLLYFACLGAAFIVVEVAMIQKSILFLGHPVYALTVVLFSLLTFSALGSYLSGRLFPSPGAPTLVRLLAVVAGVVLLYVLIIPPVFYGLVHLPHVLRIVLAVFLMAPLAILMGMPMPTAIRIVSKSAPRLIPWAWGVNGATSVMGSVGALVIAISSGFNQALIAGALLYLLACAFVRPGSESRV